jgi:hypothetical protein
MAMKISFALAGTLAITAAWAQDIPLHLTYVCNGEHIFVDSCNIRDTSDSSTCSVAHPDKPLHNGLLAYTTETRGNLKKLLPACTPPTAKQIASEDAFKKKQQEIIAARDKKAQDELNAQKANAVRVNIPEPKPAMSPEKRAMNRCVTSGRVPATCMGNALMNPFSAIIGKVLPKVGKTLPPGPEIAGAFQGAGNWRIEFDDRFAMLKCSELYPQQYDYTMEIKNNRASLTIDMTPKPLPMTIGPDGNLHGPGPVQVDGAVLAGYTRVAGDSGGFTDAHGTVVPDSQALAMQSSGTPIYRNGVKYTGTIDGTSRPNLIPKRATCVAQNLSSKNAGQSATAAATDVLKAMFNDGDKGPPTPAGIRMHGIFAASTGFSIEFFPESAVLGCGPDAARAYPYTVIADGAQAVIKVDAPDHPLTLAFKPDGSLDAGAGSYQVHGRTITGQDDNGDFKFAPLEQTCGLGTLAPSNAIPGSGAPAGNATLSIASGIPGQLGGVVMVLLRQSYREILTSAGLTIPAGTSPFQFVATACASKSPECQKSQNAVRPNVVMAIRADSTGKSVFSKLAPGTYYLMISTRLDGKGVGWDQAVEVKDGSNSMTIDLHNATAVESK